MPYAIVMGPLSVFLSLVCNVGVLWPYDCMFRLWLYDTFWIGRRQHQTCTPQKHFWLPSSLH